MKYLTIYNSSVGNVWEFFKKNAKKCSIIEISSDYFLLRVKYNDLKFYKNECKFRDISFLDRNIREVILDSNKKIMNVFLI
jgi:hypothetical protein